MSSHRCGLIAALALTIIGLAATPARAQTVATMSPEWTGEWVLDESRSDPPLMGAGAPRQSRWDAALLALVSKDGTLTVERRWDNTAVRRDFSALDGQSRAAASIVSKYTSTTNGPVFETWEEVGLPDGTDTMYERQRWTRDASGALVVVTDVRTRTGTITRHAVYTPKNQR